MKRLMAQLARLTGDYILRLADLSPEDVARLDALAKERGVSRAQMLLAAIGSGLRHGGAWEAHVDAGAARAGRRMPFWRRSTACGRWGRG